MKEPASATNSGGCWFSSGVRRVPARQTGNKLSLGARERFPALDFAQEVLEIGGENLPSRVRIKNRRRRLWRGRVCGIAHTAEGRCVAERFSCSGCLHVAKRLEA